MSLDDLVARAASGEPMTPSDHADLAVPTGRIDRVHYANRNERLGIDFVVGAPEFEGQQTLHTRVVHIPAGARNELHKHAHESVFVVIAGQGEVRVGERRVRVGPGDMAFVPRWVVHQTCNTGSETLVIAAITDFGFTAAAVG